MKEGYIDFDEYIRQGLKMHRTSTGQAPHRQL